MIQQSISILRETGIRLLSEIDKNVVNKVDKYKLVII